jgi:hypothetical protein
MASRRRTEVLQCSAFTHVDCDAYTRRGLAICAGEVLEELEEEPWPDDEGEP